MKKIMSIVILFLIMALIISNNVTWAAADIAQANDNISVNINESMIMSCPGLKRVAVANPEIADVIVAGTNELIVIGKQLGQTTLFIWNSNGRQGYNLAVINGSKQNFADLQRLIGFDTVSVSKSGKSIVLDGEVPTQADKERAEKIAEAYAEKVINLLEISNPVQVKVVAQVIEVYKTNIEELGFKWGSDLSSPGVFTFGEIADDSTIVSGAVWGHTALRGQLSLMVSKNAAKVLSQPNLITLSGQEANILVGGEIPVPVAQQNNTITIEWKNYGVSLKIKPIVGRNGKIKTDVNAEVSALDWNSTRIIKLGNGMEIPAITKRHSEAVINVSSGQTIAIGGLLSREDAQTVEKIPILGDIPIIGELFTSRSFNKGETELIILITPTLITNDSLPMAVPPSLAKQMGDTLNPPQDNNAQAGAKTD